MTMGTLEDFFEDCFHEDEAKLMPEETVAAKNLPEVIAEVEETQVGGTAFARSPKLKKSQSVRAQQQES